ncbi:MAG: hypothetical protein F9K40_14795 [Kofleriaceae bacterium]|nr:MAG: hypothetical protein F9K40_14795 [Kofleriaceae bacterium]MBZ0238494.1 hypothetical protein [Kofleriaceae bacterium]
MRTVLLVALVTAFAAACGGSSKPDTTEPTTTGDTPPPAEAPNVVTPEACEASGGTVAWDIGDGSVQCPGGTQESSKVSGGVEPALCCQPATPAPAE